MAKAYTPLTKDQRKDLHDKTVAELQTMITELDLHVAKMRLEKNRGTLENTALYSRAKDDLARCKTILTIQKQKAEKETQA